MSKMFGRSAIASRLQLSPQCMSGPLTVFLVHSKRMAQIWKGREGITSKWTKWGFATRQALDSDVTAVKRMSRRIPA